MGPEEYQTPCSYSSDCRRASVGFDCRLVLERAICCRVSLKCIVKVVLRYTREISVIRHLIASTHLSSSLYRHNSNVYDLHLLGSCTDTERRGRDTRGTATTHDVSMSYKHGRISPQSRYRRLVLSSFHSVCFPLPPYHPNTTLWCRTYIPPPYRCHQQSLLQSHPPHRNLRTLLRAPQH